MKIEKTFIYEGTLFHYYITDNVCDLCRHNPKNENPFMGYVGKCDEYHGSVIKCYKFKKIKLCNYFLLY